MHRWLTGAVLWLALIPAVAHAQSATRVDLLAGPAIISLPHANTGIAVTMRPFYLSRGGLAILPQATVFSTGSRVYGHATFVVTEVVVAADLRQSGLRPVLGGGVGLVWGLSGGRVSVHAMEGFRADIARGFEALFEARQRTLPQEATSFEIVAGFAVRL